MLTIQLIQDFELNCILNEYIENYLLGEVNAEGDTWVEIIWVTS